MTIYFDGKCAFCAWSIARLRQVDRDRALTFVDANLLSESGSERCLLKSIDASRAMLAECSSGIHEGYHAFRVVFLALSGVRWLGILMGLPPAVWVGPGIYRLIARNRHRLGCQFRSSQ